MSLRSPPKNSITWRWYSGWVGRFIGFHYIPHWFRRTSSVSPPWPLSSTYNSAGRQGLITTLVSITSSPNSRQRCSVAQVNPFEAIANVFAEKTEANRRGKVIGTTGGCNSFQRYAQLSDGKQRDSLENSSFTCFCFLAEQSFVKRRVLLTSANVVSDSFM